MRLASWLLMGCVGLSAAASAAENTVGDSQKQIWKSVFTIIIWRW